VEQIREEMERLLETTAFRNKPKLVAFLRYVVEKKLEGQEAQIKESCIGVEALSYAPGNDPTSAVRVHATRLRRLLADYYETEGRDDPVRIELPAGSYVPVFRLPGWAPEAKATTGGRRWWWAPVVLVVAAGVAVMIARPRRVVETVRMEPHQLTYGAGVTRHPAMRADGKLLVYSSDENGEEHFDIWMRELEGNPVPVRLTSDPSDEVTPDISADGRWVVYHSTRDRSIYVLPTAGGSPRWVASDGLVPRFSPDGSRIAYARIAESGNAEVMVVSRAGGPAARVSEGLHNAGRPVWSPDGKQLLVLAARPDQRDDYDWWLVPSEPGAGITARTGASRVLDAAGFGPIAPGEGPSDWDGHHVLADKRGRILQVALPEQTGKAQGAVRVLSQGPGALGLRYAGRPPHRGWVVMELRSPEAVLEGRRARIDDGRISGERRPFVTDQSLSYGPGGHTGRASMSADGGKLAYRSLRSGRWQVWVYDLAVGKESPVPLPEGEARNPVLNSAGTKAVFSTEQGPGSSVWLAVLETGQVSRICADCGTVLDWSGDERRILLSTARELVELDLAARSRRVIAGGEGYEPFDGHYADGQWVAAVMGVAGKQHLQGVILPASGAAEAEWIPVTQEPYSLMLRWAPSGALVYFFSRRDGSRCLWAQRLDPRTRRPAGDPFAVEHFHSSRARIEGMGWLALGGDWLTVNIDRASANLWLLHPGE
jgi:Tol biopolymer transport system component